MSSRKQITTFQNVSIVLVKQRESCQDGIQNKKNNKKRFSTYDKKRITLTVQERKKKYHEEKENSEINKEI